MKIVGSYIGIHDQGFSLIENNDILACYSEERFSRIKSCYNMNTFPKLSFESLQNDFNINLKDPSIDFVSAKPINFILPEVQDIINYRPIKLYDHHYSHACGTYYTSGFDENTLVISYDGGDAGQDNFTELNKDNINKYFTLKRTDTFCAFYTIKNGKLIEIDKRLRHGTIANMWYLFCFMFGLQAIKDEGKIMGLAAQGKYDEKIYNMLKFFTDNDCCKATCIIQDYFTDLLTNSPDSFEIKKKLAYNLQLLTENVMLDLIFNINKKYGPFKNLCVAGGVFANVKLNQKLNEYLSFDNIWVYPAMSDEGLSLGSAIAHGVSIGEFENRKIDNVFFGKKYTEEEINDSISKFETNYNKKLFVQSLDYNIIGDILLSGKVVGLFDGAAEYGPRALGNRSIMVEPTKKETHEYINARLHRDEIMPFAPIILEEQANEVCHYYKSNHTSEFMTMCYNVKDNWIDKIPAVINTYDGTARPQVVNKKRHQHFHSILSSYYQKSGIPVLMNTSFNGHGEPIINSPKDAFDHLSKGTIDYLIINNKICNIYE